MEFTRLSSVRDAGSDWPRETGLPVEHRKTIRVKAMARIAPSCPATEGPGGDAKDFDPQAPPCSAAMSDHCLLPWFAKK